jgi:hypothetical protein
MHLGKACHIAVPHSALAMNINTTPLLVPGFHREADENCAVLGYYAAYSGKSLPTFRVIPSLPYSLVKKSMKNPLGFLPLEGGTDRLSRNVGMDLTTIRCVTARKSADLFPLVFTETLYPSRVLQQVLHPVRRCCGRTS